MELKVTDETTLRKYLLGDASREEQDEIESSLMKDDEAYALLEAAEDDLIDESLTGKLKGRELDQFNNHFLAAPERQRKLEFSRSLRRVVDASDGRSRLSFWRRLVDSFRHRPALSFALSALIVLIIGTGWSAFEIAQLRHELQSAHAQFRALEEVATASPSSPSPVLLTINLPPGQTRGIEGDRAANGKPRIVISANNKLVQFSLTLRAGNYKTYRAVLHDPDGLELWTRDTLSSREGKAVVFIVPAELLPNGEDYFSLTGISELGASESIDSYHFVVVRQ